ncbi:hypothetical protein E4U42_006153 [Claviceps africana]|uniref:Uncharacterized protein n=1 Tax=Claviceps africana TaxID=83212 RepID=A0A8K0J4T2_9HYPO|nr:hypothetical protein E4U42_006153 [Claviceps africana]
MGSATAEGATTGVMTQAHTALSFLVSQPPIHDPYSSTTHSTSDDTVWIAPSTDFGHRRHPIRVHSGVFRHSDSSGMQREPSDASIPGPRHRRMGENGDEDKKRVPRRGGCRSRGVLLARIALVMDASGVLAGSGLAESLLGGALGALSADPCTSAVH